MIEEKKLIEVINNKIERLSNGKQSLTDEAVVLGLKIALALIDGQPKVGEWILCSERLPEENGIYIVTQEVYSTSRPRGYGYKPIGTEVDCVEYDNNGWRRAPSLYEVIAWMPLPEPYKEEYDV